MRLQAQRRCRFNGGEEQIKETRVAAGCNAQREVRRLKRNPLICLALVLVVVLLLAGVAQAKSEYVHQIPAYVQNKGCSLCHTASIPELNAGGRAWVAAGKDWSVFKPKAEGKSGAAQAQSAPAAAGKSKELPRTGGSLPYLFVLPGLAAIGAGLVLRFRRA